LRDDPSARCGFALQKPGLWWNNLWISRGLTKTSGFDMISPEKTQGIWPTNMWMWDILGILALNTCEYVPFYWRALGNCVDSTLKNPWELYVCQV
jgi:hypothetical protein